MCCLNTSGRSRGASLSQALLAACLLVIAPRGAAALAEVCPGGVTYAGECTGDLLQWCENGEIIQIDCGEQGSVCAWSEAKEFYTCMDAHPVQTECQLYGDLTWAGDCVDANTLVWCSNDAIETLECKEGMVCDWDASSGEYNCIQESASASGLGDAGGESGEESDGFGEESEMEFEGDPAPAPSSPGNEDDDIAEQARVIRGSAPGSDGKRDEARTGFISDAGAGEPEAGCSAARPLGPGLLFPLGLFTLLWLRLRRQGAR